MASSWLWKMNPSGYLSFCIQIIRVISIMVSHIAGNSTICSAACSDQQQRNIKSRYNWKSGLPLQRASNAASFSMPYQYRQTSNIRRTFTDNKTVDHSDVVGAAPVGAAPTTSSFSTYHLASLDWANTTARQDQKHSSFRICCDLY